MKEYTEFLHSRGSPITSSKNIFTTDRKIAIRYRVGVTTRPLHISSNDLAVSRNKVLRRRNRRKIVLQRFSRLPTRPNNGMNRQIRRWFGKFFDSIAAVASRTGEKRIGKDRKGRQAATGIRYGNFQFGQNLRIYPYAARDMYYAGGTVSWPSVRRGLREDGAIGVAEEGRRTRKGRGSMCVTCVAAITQSRGWLPGNAFQPPHTHTTLDQPQNPLLSLPYFTLWRTISFF